MSEQWSLEGMHNNGVCIIHEKSPRDVVDVGTDSAVNSEWTLEVCPDNVRSWGQLGTYKRMQDRSQDLERNEIAFRKAHKVLQFPTNSFIPLFHANMSKSVWVWVFLFLESGCLAQNVKVSVYYETLCPYSANFLVSQFYPTYQNHAGQMEVDLIPYGKANPTNDSGTWTFECQHGPAECYGNKVHSCALHLFSIEQSTEFVVCSMNSSNATSDTSSELCATSSNISWTTLKECVSSN
ncbi:hypothetical protein NQ315_016894 [Exocentrus adspersus]|uniref:Gamma-interferon-inducible lysosomal thiol reductase n=1 Tax=Exocentrus adspersus TaxID=1586481 RepID=A0AAV8VXX2_9CUCU|nr:hypothetical protein NQ315_016894 [Exocentrus adspersus]